MPLITQVIDDSTLPIKRRPIGSFKAPFRIWARARRGAVDAWESATVDKSYFNNSKGKRIGDGVWRTSVLAHIDSAENRFTLEVQNDLSACFESVDRQLLWDSAVALGYPLSVLRVSLMSYSWRRFVSLDGIETHYWTIVFVPGGID